MAVAKHTMATEDTPRYITSTHGRLEEPGKDMNAFAPTRLHRWPSAGTAFRASGTRP
jgi:hypothetical protein